MSSTPVARIARPRRSVTETLVARMAAHDAANPQAFTSAHAVLEDARQAGLLTTETEHVSFRVPKALLEAAKCRTGLTSNTDLGLVALASLALPDPVAEVMKRDRGLLGKTHTLEY